MTHDTPVIPAERSEDLVGLEHLEDAQLALFMAGNQFMLMEDLVCTFRNLHPEVRRIYYQSLPPGLQLRQILAGGARFRDRTIAIWPDIYSSVSREAMQRLWQAGRAREEESFVYLHNRLTLMVRAGNPKGIASVEDLGRADVRVSQPSPEHEDIAAHVLNMYRAAGGEDLVRTIMEEKRQDGATLMTTVHHRETPQRILADQADVGPVWHTELVHARGRELAVEGVEPGRALDQRDAVDYWICPLADAPNHDNALLFLDYLQQPDSQSVFLKYGFTTEFI